VLAGVVGQKASLGTLLPAAKKRVAERDQALLQELCFGVCRYYFSLRETVEKYLNKKIRDKDTDLLCLLLVGAYQARYMRVPDYAVVSDCVEACRALSKKSACGMVNAVLRKVVKDQVLPVSAEAGSDLPTWLLGKIVDVWPGREAEIFTVLQQQAPMTLRVNARVTDRDDYIQLLASQQIGAAPTTMSDMGVQLNEAVDVKQLPKFTEGFVSVQDEGAQLAAPLLDVKDGHRVLDACAAPGGKTCHILESISSVDLLACDKDENRLNEVRENLQRLQLGAEVQCVDLASPATNGLAGEYDRILLDTPCSATGVIRRHPDIKLLRRESDIETLVVLQKTLLQELWKLLAPGGKLLYTTCSILPEENEEVVASFLAKADDASVIPLTVNWGMATAHGRQLLPQEGGHDGFYFALLEKLPA
jgi:16S rRNA (cytosine967-C5)-methyltransferase